MKAIVKFRKYPITKAINDSFRNQTFSFSSIERKDVGGEINKLNSHIQDTDIPVKIFKENIDFFWTIFSYFLMKQLVHVDSRFL